MTTATAPAPTATLNVRTDTGGRVHLPHPGFKPNDTIIWPHCRSYGANAVRSRYVHTDAPVDCSHCLVQLERRELAAARAAAAAPVLDEVAAVERPRILAPARPALTGSAAKRADVAYGLLRHAEDTFSHALDRARRAGAQLPALDLALPIFNPDEIAKAHQAAKAFVYDESGDGRAPAWVAARLVPGANDALVLAAYDLACAWTCLLGNLLDAVNSKCGGFPWSARYVDSYASTLIAFC